MSPIFKSGAFIRQCFAVHPLSLSVKLFSPPDKIGIVCANCDMRHRLTIAEFLPFLEDDSSTQTGTPDELSHCVGSHPEELRISGVDMGRDVVQVRCGNCQRRYHLDVTLFETHQK